MSKKKIIYSVMETRDFYIECEVPEDFTEDQCEEAVLDLIKHEKLHLDEDRNRYMVLCDDENRGNVELIDENSDSLMVYDNNYKPIEYKYDNENCIVDL